MDQTESKRAKQTTGIRQGCPLSLYLFILVMDRLFATIPEILEEHKKGMKIPNKKS